MKKEVEKLVQKLAKKGKIAANIAQLNFEKLTLERKIAKLHSKLGERIDTLFKDNKDLKEDDIVQGIIEEIRKLEAKIDEIKAAINELKLKMKEVEEDVEEKVEDKDEPEDTHMA